MTVGQVATLPITLTVGAATQNVTVTAEAPAVEMTTSVIKNVVEQQAILDIPLNTRNPADLLYTGTGVTDALVNPTSTHANNPVSGFGNLMASESIPISNGIRPGGTYFSLDGAGNLDPYSAIGGPFPNPDATQEFAVVTGSYGARYVSSPGGAVNVVTKSGTNQIHGSVFEFIRNGFFNANNYFAVTPDNLHRNQFGFAEGARFSRTNCLSSGHTRKGSIASRTHSTTTSERQRCRLVNSFKRRQIRQ